MFIHDMYVNIYLALTKAIPIMFECITTYFQTLQTWKGNNTTRYRNFNALPIVTTHVTVHFLPV